MLACAIAYTRFPHALFKNGYYPSFSHPVVRTHPETKRKALFINRTFTTRIQELADEESQIVLEMLLNHCEQLRFQARFRWKKMTWQSGTTAVSNIMPFGTIGLKNAEGEELPLLETGPSEPSFLIKQDSPTFFLEYPIRVIFL